MLLTPKKKEEVKIRFGIEKKYLIRQTKWSAISVKKKEYRGGITHLRDHVGDVGGMSRDVI